MAGRRLTWLLLAAAAYSAVLLVVGIVAGDWASDNNVKLKVMAALSGFSSRSSSAQGVVRWAPIAAAAPLHQLEYARITLQPFDGILSNTVHAGGAIEEVDGHIVFATPTGRMAYLSRDHVLTPLPFVLPTNVDALREQPLFQSPRFIPTYFRVMDLLAVERSAGEHDLYASHERFADGDCFEFVISRARIESDGDGLRMASDWEDFFVAAPCSRPDPEGFWAGLEGGGRMVLTDPNTMLVSIGDYHQYDADRVRFPVPTSQDPATHLGKIVEIDLPTGRARLYASGLRNPQGLLAAGDGVIWETEHGPRGGDEINIIREGANYGWPYVTYGTDYGGRRRVDWPFNAVQGRHDGYERPVWSFVPSIGPSNLIEPDLREFPLWRDHLLMASLEGETLFLVRLEDGKPIYASPIPLGHGRLRDMIALDDGRIALLIDFGGLVILRNEERLEGQASPSEAEFELRMAPNLLVDEPAEAPAPPLAERGEQLFLARCATCHRLDAVVAAGPPLDGVLERRVGSAADFSYSSALAARDETWTPDLLRRFLTDPEADFPGSAMAPAGLSREDAAAVAAFLATR